MPHCKKAIERHQQRKIQQRLEKIKQRRHDIARLVREHMVKANDDWESLEKVLPEITRLHAVESLFTHSQKDVITFKKDEPAHVRMTKELVATRKGKYHLRFFALAPGFRGTPHSHGGVNCVSTVLRGPFTETLFAKTDDQTVKPISKEVRHAGSVVSDIGQASHFIHNVSNENKSHIIYSIHLYGRRPVGEFNQYYKEEAEEKNALNNR